MPKKGASLKYCPGCQDLKKQGRLIIDCEKKEMIKLTEEEQYKYYAAKECFIYKKQFLKMKRKLY